MTSIVPAEGVRLDCDGVLVDSLEAAAVAWDAWAERYAPTYDFVPQMRHGVRAAEMIATLVRDDILDEAVAGARSAGADDGGGPPRYPAPSGSPDPFLSRTGPS